MKKLLTYTISTMLILGFSIDKNAYAEKIPSYSNEVVKLQSEYKTSIFLDSINRTQTLNNNASKISSDSDFNPALMNFIIPGFTQFYYGEALKGFLFFCGTVLAPVWIIPALTLISNMNGGTTAGNALSGVWLVFVPFIAYIWSLIDANAMVYDKLKLNKVSSKNGNLFNLALFSKDF